MKETDKISLTRFLAKYGGLSLYNIHLKKRYTVYHEGIRFVNKYEYTLTSSLYHPEGTSTDHKYF